MNLKPLFLVKGGYYIGASPSTALDFSFVYSLLIIALNIFPCVHNTLHIPSITQSLKRKQCASKTALIIFVWPRISTFFFLNTLFSAFWSLENMSYPAKKKNTTANPENYSNKPQFKSTKSPKYRIALVSNKLFGKEDFLKKRWTSLKKKSEQVGTKCKLARLRQWIFLNFLVGIWIPIILSNFNSICCNGSEKPPCETS